MPVITQKRIYRSDLRSNPNVLYLFGDNDERVGLGGQAGEMRGEPNARGIRTKWRPGMSYADFFHDKQYPEACKMIDEDFNDVWQARFSTLIVVPEDGLGTGLSMLQENAPKVLRHIDNWINNLKGAAT